MMLIWLCALSATGLRYGQGSTFALETELEDKLELSAELDLKYDLIRDVTELQNILLDPSKLQPRSKQFLQTDPKKVEKVITQVASVATAALHEAQPKPPVAKKTGEKTDDDEEKKEMDKMVNIAKTVPVNQMPLLLGLMKDMYDRFKKNIARANALESKSKNTYKKNLAEKAKWPESFLKDKAMLNLAHHWDKQRELSHRHYHNMLKLSHAGMARLQVAMDMMEQAIAGKALSPKQMETLKTIAPSGGVVFIQEDLLKFCSETLSSLNSMN